MAGAEGVVFALVALAEAGQASRLAERADAVAAPGQNLVGVGLVAHVPDQPVVGRIEHMMQGNGELDHAQTCAEMASGDRDRVDGLLAQLLRQLRQLVILKRAQLLRIAHPVKQRRWAFSAHSSPWRFGKSSATAVR